MNKSKGIIKDLYAEILKFTNNLQLREILEKGSTTTDTVINNEFAHALRRLIHTPNNKIFKKYPYAFPILARTYLNLLHIPIKARFNGVLVVDNLLSKPILDSLSSGSFGDVYRTSDNYAVKVMKEFNVDIDGKNVMLIGGDSLREISILRYLDHPGIIPIVGAQLEPMMYKMPLAIGTLATISPTNPRFRKLVYYQILRGLAYLHSKYIWHMDIKPANILIFPGNPIHVCIADFGLSQIYARRYARNTTRTGTLGWLAPEILMDYHNYDGSVDIWAVGVMLFNTLTGSNAIIPTVFSKSDQLTRIFTLIGTPTNDDIPNIYQLSAFITIPPIHSRPTINSILTPLDPNAQVLIKSMLNWPKHRPTALQALTSSYFDDVENIIETAIPAPPIQIQTCGELMIREEVVVPNIHLTPQILYNIYTKLYEISMNYRYKLETFTFAIFLIDNYLYNYNTINENLIFAALLLASLLYEQASLNTYNKYSTDYGINIYECINLMKVMIALLDFKLLIPSIGDYLYVFATPSENAVEDYGTSIIIKHVNNPTMSPSECAKEIIREYNLQTCVEF